MLPVDLHVHSNRSDGTLSPARLVDYAREKGLAAFALTDHDTVDGLDEALSRAEELRQEKARTDAHTDAPAPKPHALPPVPEVIPGIELSTEYHGEDIHVVGLFIDHHNTVFRERLREFVDSRTVRNQKMCALLREAGIPVTYEDLCSAFPDAVITRAHYAKYMLTHGYINDMSEAFERYIGDGCPCYLPREKITPLQAVELILQAGGAPVLAHPLLYHLTDLQLNTLIAELKEAGLIGLEAVYSTHTAADERRMRALAAKHGLAVSGGSDFHGSNKPDIDLGTGRGQLFVSADLLETLRDMVKGR